MGEIISHIYFSPKKTEGLLKPIIYCCKLSEVENKAVSINLLLAQELINIEPDRRTRKIEKCFTKVIASFQNEMVIKDFDVLFNPNYKIDVLKVIISAYKMKPFSVIWPGTFDGGKLIYAEESYPDYREYYVKLYDITCII